MREDLVIRQLHEIRRQDEDAIRTRGLGGMGQFDRIGRADAARADDHRSAASRAGDGIGIERLALSQRQAPELAGTAAGDDAGRTFGQQPRDIRAEPAAIHLACGVEWGRDRGHRPGPVHAVAVHLRRFLRSLRRRPPGRVLQGRLRSACRPWRRRGADARRADRNRSCSGWAFLTLSRDGPLSRDLLSCEQDCVE